MPLIKGQFYSCARTKCGQKPTLSRKTFPYFPHVLEVVDARSTGVRVFRTYANMSRGTLEDVLYIALSTNEKRTACSDDGLYDSVLSNGDGTGRLCPSWRRHSQTLTRPTHTPSLTAQWSSIFASSWTDVSTRCSRSWGLMGHRGVTRTIISMATVSHMVRYTHTTVFPRNKPQPNT